MPKNILIFSDGTGQIGGLAPDQRLSNIYKMYRAMRSGPDSPISPLDQVAFYDPGLGAGEVGGLTLRRLRNIIAAAVGTGISENMIDCYEAILANYEPGDHVFLFGFSRGAYTARCVANVMNLCGVPTLMPDGRPIPTHGPELRKIASDAVLFVYEHGSGKERGAYEIEREEKARRFRDKYHSNGIGADGESQGNVQPYFIGVFDTVAALGSKKIRTAGLAIVVTLMVLSATTLVRGWPVLVSSGILLLTAIAIYWLGRLVWRQFKYVRKDGKFRWHFAAWNLKHYDRFLDNKVRFARHALAIDETRKNFPSVAWGSAQDVRRNEHLKPSWLRQVWFAGNHSDIGGSYPESESRLSDIALDWMIEELKEAAPNVLINEEKLYRYPLPTGMQHDEIEDSFNRLPSIIPACLRRRLIWPKQIREINPAARLHPTVLQRFDAPFVSQLGRRAPYRSASLRTHNSTQKYYSP